MKSLLLLAALLAILGALAKSSAPELQRYMKIRSM
jgi:hypothetical protein